MNTVTTALRAKRTPAVDDGWAIGAGTPHRQHDFPAVLGSAANYGVEIMVP